MKIHASAMVLAVAVVAGMLSGCVLTRTPMNNVTSLADVDFSKSFKSSEACQTRILFFAPVGDASVMAAAKAGGISKVEVVDITTLSAILLTKACTKVWGH